MKTNFALIVLLLAHISFGQASPQPSDKEALAYKATLRKQITDQIKALQQQLTELNKTDLPTIKKQMMDAAASKAAAQEAAATDDGKGLKVGMTHEQVAATFAKLGSEWKITSTMDSTYMHSEGWSARSGGEIATISVIYDDAGLLKSASTMTMGTP